MDPVPGVHRTTVAFALWHRPHPPRTPTDTHTPTHTPACSYMMRTLTPPPPPPPPPHPRGSRSRSLSLRLFRRSFSCYSAHLSYTLKAILRNKRCLLAYSTDRTKRLEELRWDVGAVLPMHVRANLSQHEVEYFSSYSKGLNTYALPSGGCSALEPFILLFFLVGVPQTCRVRAPASTVNCDPRPYPHSCHHWHAPPIHSRRYMQEIGLDLASVRCCLRLHPLPGVLPPVPSRCLHGHDGFHAVVSIFSPSLPPHHYPLLCSRVMRHGCCTISVASLALPRCGGGRAGAPTARLLLPAAPCWICSVRGAGPCTAERALH